MGCNLAALSPISSYGPFITGLIAAELLAAGIEGSEWGIWLNMLPFNLYGVFAMITVLIVATFGLNFGPMYKEESGLGRPAAAGRWDPAPGYLR